MGAAVTQKNKSCLNTVSQIKMNFTAVVSNIIYVISNYINICVYTCVYIWFKFA